MDHNTRLATAAANRLNEALTRVDLAVAEAFTRNTLEDLPTLRMASLPALTTPRGWDTVTV